MLTYRSLTAAGALAGGVVAFALYARQASPDFVPIGDISLLESYTRYASRGQLFVGFHSRLGWHHPGPLYFYVLVPFYALSGGRTAGLLAAAAVINLLSLLAILSVTARAARASLTVAVGGLALLYLLRIAPVIPNPWTPFVLMFPTMALIVICAAMIDGRIALMPVAAALASFIGQTHVGLVPVVLAITAASTMVATTVAYRDAARRGQLWMILIATALVVGGLWLPPLVDQFTAPRGNLTQLWDFFVHQPGEGQTFRRAFVASSAMLSAVIRPDFSAAAVDPLGIRQDIWVQAWASLQIILLAGVALRAWWMKETFESALASLLLLASLVALWSIMRIVGPVHHYLVVWLSGIGALNNAVLLHAGVSAISQRVRTWPTRWTTVVCGMLFGLAVIVAFQHLRVLVRHSFRPTSRELAARRFAEGIEIHLRDTANGKPLIRIEPPSSNVQPTWEIAAGSILKLQRDGVRFGIEEGWLSVFTNVHAATGDEAMVLTFAGPGERDRLLTEPGQRVIAERERVSLVAGPLTSRLY